MEKCYKWDSIIKKALENIPTELEILRNGTASYINMINILEGDRKNIKDCIQDITKYFKENISIWDIRKASLLISAFRNNNIYLIPKKLNLSNIVCNYDNDGDWAIFFN